MIDRFDDLIPSIGERGMDLSLERMKKALEMMSEPCKEVPAIQIVGTNGKGSITRFIQSCLSLAGISTGVTISPHLISWCERIQVDSKNISADDLRDRLIKLKSITEINQLTPFEILIATAFDYFSEKNVKLLLLEVGLGGRLDATTAHPYRPIITFGPIGLDHCEHLGTSLESIAYEKASVINQESIVISCHQLPKVTKTLKSIAKQKGSEIRWVEPLSKDWNLGLAGNFQRENAAVAKAALEALDEFGWHIEKNKIEEGFARATWPGRLQSVSWNNKPLILDGAHNPLAAENLSKERMEWKRQESGVHWILGIQSHKQAPEMLKHLIKPNDIIWIVPVPQHKSWSKEELLKVCKEFSNQIHQANNVEQILSKLLSKKEWPKPAPVIAGSLYLIGEFLTHKTIEKI